MQGQRACEARAFAEVQVEAARPHTHTRWEQHTHAGLPQGAADKKATAARGARPHTSHPRPLAQVTCYKLAGGPHWLAYRAKAQACGLVRAPPARGRHVTKATRQSNPTRFAPHATSTSSPQGSHSPPPTHAAGSAGGASSALCSAPPLPEKARARGRAGRWRRQVVITKPGAPPQQPTCSSLLGREAGGVRELRGRAGAHHGARKQ